MKITSVLKSSIFATVIFGFGFATAARAENMIYGQGVGRTVELARADSARNLEFNFNFFQKRCVSSARRAEHSNIAFGSPLPIQKDRGFTVDSSAAVTCE